MQIPVLLTDLCSGTGPDDPARLVHAPLKSEEAARRLLIAAKSEQASGQLILTPGADVFLVPRAATIEAPSFADAQAQGYTIDNEALRATWEAAQVVATPAPIEPPPVEAAPESPAVPPPTEAAPGADPVP